MVAHFCINTHQLVSGLILFLQLVLFWLSLLSVENSLAYLSNDL